MPNKPKYLYADGILKRPEKLVFLILNERGPSGPFSKAEKLQRNPICATLDQALFYLKEIGYRTPSPFDVQQNIQNAFQDGRDAITIEISPN